MIKKLLVLLMLGAAINVCAQQITKYEYWFDSDVGNRTTGTPQGNEINLSLDVNGMLEGLHTLSFRAADNNGLWSAPHTYYFLHYNTEEGQNRITTIEYWTDSNTARRTSAASDGNVAMEIDVSGLLDGLHTLSYRFKDNNGLWSAPHTQYFMKVGHNREYSLKRYEYWIDRDPATKTTVQTSNGVIQLDIDVSSLAKGVHTLTFCAEDDNGRWSAPLCQYFLCPQEAFNDGRIMGYEYWFNNAREATTYVKLPEPVEPLLLNVELPVNSINRTVTPENIALVRTEDGKYKIGTRNLLHTRFKNTDSYWSAIQTDTFTTVIDGADLNLTGLIANPDASKDWQGWSTSGDKHIENGSHWSGETNPYFCLGNNAKSSWTTTMEQTVSGLPAGTYILTAVGRATEGTVLELSAGDNSVTFPTTGAEGGEIWDDAAEGSPERMVNDGKGYGWSQRELVFTTNGDPFAVKVKATAERKGLWADIDDISLQLNSVTQLDVVFADTVDMAEYNDMRLVLSSSQSRQTLTTRARSHTYSFRGLSSNAIYALALQNRYGQDFMRMDNISLNEGDNTITPNGIAKVVGASVEVKDTLGHNVTTATKVTWTGADGSYLADGKALAGIPEGCAMTVDIALGDSLGTIYHEVEALPVVPKSGNTLTTVTLKPIETISVGGQVNNEYGPTANATVSAVQLLNGKYRRTQVATTGTDGRYRMTLMNDSTVLTASLDGYVDGKAGYPDFNTTTKLGTITLQPIRGRVVNAVFNYTRSTTIGNEADRTGWFADYANVDYVVKNKTKGKDVTGDVTVQKGTLILPETTEAGDVIEITARSKTGTFADATASTAIAAEGDTDICFDITELGGVKATYTASGNENNVALLYDSNGRQMASTRYVNSQAEYNHLPAGAYRLVSLGESRMLGSISNLADLENVGMMEGRDYAACDVNVNNGIISEVTVQQIPELDEMAFYYTTQNTQFSVNKSSVVTGNFVTVTAKIELKEQYAATADGLTLTIDLPEGCAYVENSAIIGTAAAPYVLDGDRLIISLTRENYRERIRFCLMPTQSGSYTPGAILNFENGNETAMQPLGTAAFEAEDISINVPVTTPTKSITVSGIATANAEISVFDGNVLIGKTQSFANGFWSCLCTLNEPYNLTEHQIHAVITSPLGISAKTETKTVEYDMNFNDVRTVTMINTAHGPSSLKTCEYVTVFDFQKPSSESPVYWYWPNYPDFTFTIDFFNNDPNKVTDVILNVITSSGKTVPLSATYNKEKDKWIANRKFYSESLPVNVSVGYNTIDTLVLDREYIDKLAQTPIDIVNDYINYLDTLDNFKNEFDNYVDNYDGEDILQDSLLNYYMGNLGVFDDETTTDIPTFDISDEAKDLINRMNNAKTQAEMESVLNDISNYVAIAEEMIRQNAEDAQKGISDGTFACNDGTVIRKETAEGNNNESLQDEGFTNVSTSDGSGVYVKANTSGASYVDLSNNRKVTITRPHDGFDPNNCSLEQATEYSRSLCAKLSGTTQVANNMLTMITKPLEIMVNDLHALDKVMTHTRYEIINGLVPELYPGFNKDFAKEHYKLRNKKIALNKYLGVIKVMNTIFTPASCAFTAADIWDERNKTFNSFEDLLGNIYMCLPADKAKVYEDKIKNIQRQNTISNIVRGTVSIGTTVVAGAGIAGSTVTFGSSLLITGTAIYAQWAIDKAIKKFIDDRNKKSMDEIVKSIDWKNCIYDQNGFNPQTYMRLSGCQDAEHVQDPSGYVYEAVTSNRLEGVTVTVYQKEQKEDMYGDKYEEVTKWDAEAYQQKNPLTTDINGYYAWDVPQGLWQVKYEKDGYETVYSEWLPVPPPQLDINVGMSHAVAPEVKQMRGFESGITVEMSKYMRPESYTPGCITVLRNGVEEKGSVVMLNTEKDPYENREFVSKVKFVPDVSFNTTDHVMVTVHKGLESYCGMKLADDCTRLVVIEPEIRSINADSVISVAYNGTVQVEVNVVPADAASGKTLYVNASSPTIASTDMQEVAIGKDGKARFSVSGNLPGCAALTFSMDETDIIAQSKIEVTMPLEQVATPKASIESGTLVESGTAVSLSTDTEGATIYYTTDGSCPCEETGRKLYEEPIVIVDNVTIKAVAVKDGYDDSEVATFVYSVVADAIGHADVPSSFSISVRKGRIAIENASGCTLGVYSASGETVYSKARLTDHEIVRGLLPGCTYIVRLYDAKGNGITTKVLID